MGDLRAHLSAELLITSREELIDRELAFFEFRSPIGLIFRFGLGVSVLVGLVILYQILYQITTKYIQEYATLKAIGYTDFSVAFIVIQTAMILALQGFLPGLGISIVLYSVLEQSTGLDFVMTVPTAAAVFLVVMLICQISAVLAIRVLRRADPAELF